jgi:hypothetical protein
LFVLLTSISVKSIALEIERKKIGASPIPFIQAWPVPDDGLCCPTISSFVFRLCSRSFGMCHNLWFGKKV